MARIGLLLALIKEAERAQSELEDAYLCEMIRYFSALHVILLVLLALWIVYAIYCLVRSNKNREKFAESLERNRAKRFLSNVTDERAQLIGTRHSFSSLITNAKTLDKRVQETSVITQLQDGIRVLEMDVWLKRLTKAELAERDNEGWAKRVGKACEEKISSVLERLFEPRVRHLTMKMMREKRSLPPETIVPDKNNQLKDPELEPLIMTNGVRTDLNVIDYIDIMAQCAEKLDIDRIFVCINSIGLLDENNEMRYDGDRATMINKFIEAIRTNCKCPKFKRVVLVEKEEFERKFDVIDQIDMRTDKLTKTGKSMDEDTENKFLLALDINKKAPAKLIWVLDYR